MSPNEKLKSKKSKYNPFNYWDKPLGKITIAVISGTIVFFIGLVISHFSFPSANNSLQIVAPNSVVSVDPKCGSITANTVLQVDTINITPQERRIASEQNVHQLPDIALRFIYPDSPALVLVNQSAVIARDIKWAVALWNMDLPERNDPLPIPVTAFDWIKAHDESGPNNLFDGPLVSPLLKQGDRLFGSASVNCAECARGRTYIVYIVWGKNGWFSEVEIVKPGRILSPPNFLKTSRIKYFKALEAAVPEQSKIPISDR